MKPNSTPRNSQTEANSGLGDVLYSIYVLEFETRGVNYLEWLSMLPELTSGLLSPDTATTLVKRLAANPSIFSVMLSTKPIDVISRLIHSDDNDVQVTHVTDLLDDITVNCRLRDPALFDRNQTIFFEQLEIVVKANTNMTDEEKSNYDQAMHKYGYLLMTLHYLRKIGCNYVSRERRSET